MKITAFTENSCMTEEYRAAYGSTWYIETEYRNILFNAGNIELFLENAQKLRIDVKDIDIIVISPGCFDFARLLEYFLDINQKVKIYVPWKEYGKYLYQIFHRLKGYGDTAYTFYGKNRIIFVDENMRIEEGFELFTVGTEENIMLKAEGKIRTRYRWGQESPAHKQNMILCEDEKTVLFAGGTDEGRINIVEHAKKVIGKKIDYVFGGFQLFNSNFSSADAPVKVNGTYFYTSRYNGLREDSSKECSREVKDHKMNYISAGQLIEV